MKYIHRHQMVVGQGTPGEALYLFIFHYHFEEGVVILDDVMLHPVVDNIVMGNVLVSPQEITEDVYDDAIAKMKKDGLFGGV